MNERIEKSMELSAPIARVWQALTDYREFNQWFHVNLNQPFIVGKSSSGLLTYPGYEHNSIEIRIKEMVPERLFSYNWHPYALDNKRDYSKEIPTLVEFHLKKLGNETLLTITESGFNQLPNDRRLEAFQMHEEGWSEQLENIKNYVEKTAVER